MLEKISKWAVILSTVGAALDWLERLWKWRLDMRLLLTLILLGIFLVSIAIYIREKYMRFKKYYDDKLSTIDRKIDNTTIQFSTILQQINGILGAIQNKGKR